MPHIIDMPKLSDTMTVGTLAKWLKKEGDVVKTGDMLAEVETDKATMELECFFDGTLLKIFAPGGSQVPIGAPLCAIGKPGEKVEVPATPAATPAQPPAKAAAPAATKPAAAATAPVAAAPSGSPKHAKAAPPPTPAAPKTPPAAALPPAAPGTAGTDVRVKISPLARKLAAEKGLDVSGVAGSGPRGRIVRADVLAAATAAPSGISNLRSEIPGQGAIQEDRVATVSNMRGTIARRLLESKTQLPHFYIEVEIDAAPLLALREQLNTGLESQGVKLSVNDFILKASAEALRRVPQVNASWETGPAATGPAQIRYFGAVHLAFAVAIDDGLITPVIRDAHLKSVFAISAEAKALGRRAKDKKLKPEEFTGGTFCVSNLGMMGIPRFTAIINPPNAVILAVGAILKKPVVRNDQLAVGQTMILTLSCDHRVVDGAIGAQYLNALKALLEAPALLLV